MVFKAGYRRLPKELIDYIWNYDNRYKLLFKNCVYELIRYFHKHRLIDLLCYESHLYFIYENLNKNRYDNLYGYKCNLSEYILKRKKLFNISYFHTLQYYKLQNI